MNFTIKTAKSVEGFSQGQYQLYYLIKKIIIFREESIDTKKRRGNILF